VMAKYRNAMEPLPPAFSLGLCATAFLLAVGSYYWVEQPFRKSRRDGVRATSGRVFAVSGAMAAVLVSAGIGLKVSDGLPMRVPEQVAALDRARMPVIPFVQCDEVAPHAREDCRVGAAAGRPLALIWGDSHAMAWAPGLDELLKEEGWAGQLAVNSTCAPLTDVGNPKDPNCHEYNDEIINWVKKNRPDRVYLIAAWFAWSNTENGYDLTDLISGQKGNERIFGPALSRTIERLLPNTNKIVVIATTPGAVDSLPYKLAMGQWRNLAAPRTLALSEYRNQSQNFWLAVKPYSGVIDVVDPESWFCNEAECRFTYDGKLLYRDGDHLSVEGAHFAASHLTLERSPTSMARAAAAVH
jgi:hypothetical protein